MTISKSMFCIGDIVRITKMGLLGYGYEGEVIGFDDVGDPKIRFGEEARTSFFSSYMYDFTNDIIPETMTFYEYPLEVAFESNHVETIGKYSPKVLADRYFFGMYHSVQWPKSEPQYGSDLCAVDYCQQIAVVETITNFVGTVCFMPTCQMHHDKLHLKSTESW